MPKIISIGDLALDVLLPARLPVTAGVHQAVNGRGVEPGGACNFMICARRLGAEVMAVGTVGGDLFGAEVVRVLQAEGVDTTFVAMQADATTTLVVALHDAVTGAHTFVGEYGKGAAMAYPAALDDVIAFADAVFAQGHSLLENCTGDLTRRAVRTANQLGTTVCFDAGPFVGQFTPEQVQWMIDSVDVLLLTDDELDSLLALTGGDVYELLVGRPQFVVAKAGQHGCRVFHGGKAHQFHGFGVDVVDTIGAGDCFDVGYVLGYMRGWQLAECATLANACGAAAVQNRGGGRQVPTCEQVNQVLEVYEANLRVCTNAV